MQHSNLSSKQNSQNNVSEKKEILPPLRGESEGGSSQKAKRGKMFAFVFLILALIAAAACVVVRRAARVRPADAL